MPTVEGDGEQGTDSFGVEYYFAIGSMCHMMSWSNRGLTPLSSQPGEVLDFKLIFTGDSGWAEARRDVGSSFHGVLHTITVSDLKKLDQVEEIYDRVQCQCRTYDGQQRNAWIYTMKNDEAIIASLGSDKPPKERYLSIIIEGCKHHNVAQSHIDWLQSIEFVKRKDSRDFNKLFVPPDSPTFNSHDEIFARGSGVDGQPLLMSLNGKVIDWLPEAVGYKLFTRSAGMPLELQYSKVLYDPLYGCPERIEDFSSVHCASIEDALASQVPCNYRVVGLIKQNYKE